MKEPNDPSRDGFLRVEDIVPLLAGDYRMRDDGDYLYLTHIAGRVRDDTLRRLLEEGWIKSFPNGCGFELTDEGRKAYMRSTDEMGDGVLHPPSGGGGT